MHKRRKLYMILLPIPKQMKEEKGTYMLRLDAMIVMDGTCPQDVLVYAQQLREEMIVWAGLSLEIGRGTVRPGDILMRIDDSLSEEHYNLKIEENGVVVRAGSKNALGWGVQTLRQIVRQSAGLLPCVVIEDEPDMKNRGFYHDVTRGRVQTLENLKKLADKLSFYKLNQLQLYVEHTYLFRDLTELWRDDTPLTATEIIELDQYCYERGIELIPSLSTFGHLYKLLGTKSYEQLCEMPDKTSPFFSFIGRMDHHTIDVSNSASLELVKNMITEYMQLFRTDKFNICADETFDLGKGKSATLAAQKGVGVMYMEYIKELFDFLIEQGKTPMFWGDIICKHPELYEQLPKEVICLNWGYSDTQPDTQIQTLYKVGATQYVCPGVCGWNTWINDFRMSYDNITRMCKYGRTYHAVGVLNTDWGDFGHINHPVFSIPGLIYGAVGCWGEQIPEYEELNRQISILEFADASGEWVSLLGKIVKETVFDWNSAVYIKEWAQAKREEKEILSILEKCDMEEVPEANERLTEIETQSYLISRKIDSQSRNLMEIVQTALEAVRVWNEVGLFLVKLQKKQSPENGRQIAERLERCLHQYQRLWRHNSKEGDLRWISEVFCWYADRMREFSKQV